MPGEPDQHHQPGASEPGAPGAAAGRPGRSSPPGHPLVPLTAEEVTASRELLAAGGHLAASTRFASVVLAEPAKADLLAWREGVPVPRRARSVLWDRADGHTHEALVDLVAGRVESPSRTGPG